MVITNKTFWDEFKGNYEDTVVSIFENNNELIKVLNEIKNKDKKIIADFGCGVGKAAQYIKEFKKIYEIDFSKNMLNKAKENIQNEKNFLFIEGKNENLNLPEKVDIILSVNSIFPEKYEDFDLIVENYKKNTKKNGKIILVLGSFEFRTFIYQLYSKYLFSIKKNPLEIQNILIQKQREENYNALGTLVSLQQIVQKQWLKEEIKLRLEKYNFKKIEIQKLHVEWDEKQRKEVYLKKYPKPWYWLIQLKN